MKFMLNEMAFERGKAEGKIEAYSYAIMDHLIKCVVYQNTTHDLEHWVSEISEYFININSINIKKQIRFSESYYKQLLSAPFGDEVSDCLVNLREFKLKNSGKYPDFIPTLKQADVLYNVYTILFDNVCKIFADKNNKVKSKQAFEVILINILYKDNIWE